MKEEKSQFSKWKVVLPMLIGLGVICYMITKEFFGENSEANLKSLESVSITVHTVFWLFVALLLMVGRDLGFMIRYRYLTEKTLSWTQSLKVTLLAEFGSAITPSTVGGSSMAILFLAKEGVSVGRSTTIVFVTLLLDELFFVVSVPFFLLLIPFDRLFMGSSAVETGVIGLFMIAYVIKLIICSVLILGLFFKPQAIRWLILQIFRIPFLQRWRGAAYKAGDDILVSSNEVKGKGLRYWLPLILATVLSWSSRYLVVNAIFMAFFQVHENLLMVVSPTPGGSGFSEFIFEGYLSEFIPIMGLVPVIIIIWRLLSYYNYLFIGSILVPRWARQAFGKK